MNDQHLVIEITETQDDLYRITLLLSDSKFTAETVSPFGKTELRDYLTFLSRENLDFISSENSEKITRFGQKLFQFLIGGHPDTLREYRMGLERAGNRRLLIWLSSENAGRFAALPWEFLYDEARGFLALSRQTPIIRCKPELSPRPPTPLISPLKVLVVISSPPNYPRLQIEAEWKDLHNATLQLQVSGQLSLERLEHTNWSALRRQLRTEDYHVLHYIGYTHYDETTRQGFLVLEDNNLASGSHPVSATELGAEMGSQSTIRLAILNAHPPIDSKTLLAISEQLLHTGIPAVLATQFRHNQSQAILNTEFYRPLCEAHPIEAALNVARHAIVEQAQSPDWGQIMLSLRSANGNLFRIVKPEF